MLYHYVIIACSILIGMHTAGQSQH